jgi:hypothetical protein
MVYTDNRLRASEVVFEASQPLREGDDVQSATDTLYSKLCLNSKAIAAILCAGIALSVLSFTSALMNQLANNKEVTLRAGNKLMELLLSDNESEQEEKGDFLSLLRNASGTGGHNV